MDIITQNIQANKTNQRYIVNRVKKCIPNFKKIGAVVLKLLLEPIFKAGVLKNPNMSKELFITT